MSLELHYIDGSPFARIVRILAREHGVAMREIEIIEFPPPDSFLEITRTRRLARPAADRTPVGALAGRASFAATVPRPHQLK